MKRIKANRSGFLRKIAKKATTAPKRAGKAAASKVWKKLRSIDKADKK